MVLAKSVTQMAQIFAEPSICGHLRHLREITPGSEAYMLSTLLPD
jgi:hypothetical protein